MFKITINADKLNTEERRKKAQLVRNEMELVLNSEVFEKNFLSITNYSGELSSWKHATITAILAHIRDGAETLSPEIDHEMDLFVDDYYTLSSVVGHTYEHDPFIYVNTKYFDTNSTKKIGSNFFHEWGHKMGFDHDYKKTARRNYSLCYLMNDIYEKSWNELLGDSSENDKILVCKRHLLFFQKCTWEKVHSQ